MSRRSIRIALGLFWLLDAGLQAQPDLFRADWWRGDLAQSVMGEPSTINRSIFFAVNIVASHAAVWNSLFIALQLVLGLALLLGRFERVAIIASCFWAIGVWWVGEGFGLLPTGFAVLAGGSPGAVLLYPLLGVLAWPNGRRDRAPHPVAQRPATAAWIVLWSGQALFHLPWRYTGSQVLSANIVENAAGPSWLLALDHRAQLLVQSHGGEISLLLGVLEALVGVAILSSASRRPAIVLAIALSVVYWVIFQDFGHLLAGDTTDPGTAPLVILLACSLWTSPRPGDVPAVPDEVPAAPTQLYRSLVSAS